MRLYIKGDYTKEIPFDYIELAKRMWFDTKDCKPVRFFLTLGILAHLKQTQLLLEIE